MKKINAEASNLHTERFAFSEGRGRNEVWPFIEHQRFYFCNIAEFTIKIDISIIVLEI